MVLGGSGACERRKDDTVRKGQSTDLNGGEESRRVDGGRHLSLELSRSGGKFRKL